MGSSPTRSTIILFLSVVIQLKIKFDLNIPHIDILGMAIKDLTKEQIEEYAKKSTNWKEFMTKCGYTNYGCRKYLQKKLDKYNISISHFIKNYCIKYYADEDIFKKNSNYASMTNIKKKLINKYGWNYECSNCKLNEWMGQKIPLEVDHINGVHTDNRIENLRFLCPNCHAQTDTYKGKNIKNKEHSKELYENIKKKTTCECGNKKYKEAEQCMNCYIQLKKSVNQTKEPYKYNKKTKKCISCDNIIQKESERCIDCYKKDRKENGIFEKETNHVNNKKHCPDCNKLISKKSIRCRLCNYALIKTKSNMDNKEQIKGKCIDCISSIDNRAIRCLPCSQKVIENANKNISNACIDCKATICNSAERCVDCNLINSRKVQRPSYEQLCMDKQTMSYVQIGKKYGVSDNAIRKWIKKYESH